LLMLLKAKALLALRVSKEKEKIKDSNCSLSELDIQGIQRIISNFNPGEDDADLLKRIQNLKAQLVIELRKNHGLDRSVAKLDKRIALLIKNRGKVVTTKYTKKETPRGTNRKLREINLTSKAIENYQDLFYLLQTEPRYLARVVYLVNPDQMESFLEMTILTLYGGAFSPREEFLVLRLFQLAMQHEISVVSHVSDFLQQETVVPKMIVTYNRRKLGLTYIQKVLGPAMNTFLETDMNMELSPMAIYANMINEQEIRTGEKSKLDRQVTPEQASENPEVKEIVEQRLNEISDTCKLFIDAIICSVNQLPYGLRWICKQLSAISREALPGSTELDIRRLIGYFVYYRFLNLAIVAPDSKQVQLVKKELTPVARKSCVVISKVLQNLFNLRLFKEDNKPDTLSIMRLNPFLEEYFPKVENYFDALIKVDDPEDHLQVDKYMELTQKSKPMIQISLHEIFQTHQMVYQHLDKIASEKEDPLRRVLDDLGGAPEHTDLSEEEDRDIQLTLTNRFKADVEEESESEKRYAETKELLIPVLRMVPVKTTIQRLNLVEMLEYCQEYGKKKDEELVKKVERIRDNVKYLEKAGMMSRDDNYESFINDVGIEVLNRNEIREQQKKEIVRLETTLNNLRLHQTFLQTQTKEYNSYLEDVLQSLYARPVKGGKSNKQAQKIGPFKFTYKNLQKRGVLVDSEVPMIARGSTSFWISSEEPGTFDIEAKVKGKTVEKMHLRFDDLLERHYDHATRLELEQVTLDVNMTIHLINTLFQKKK